MQIEGAGYLPGHCLLPYPCITSGPHVVPQDPNIAASAMSPFRVRKDHYKGMTEAEKKAILDAQLAQMEEKKARRAQEQLENMMYARTQHDIQRALQEQVRGGQGGRTRVLEGGERALGRSGFPASRRMWLADARPHLWLPVIPLRQQAEGQGLQHPHMWSVAECVAPPQAAVMHWLLLAGGCK